MSYGVKYIFIFVIQNNYDIMNYFTESIFSQLSPQQAQAHARACPEPAPCQPKEVNT